MKTRVLLLLLILILLNTVKAQSISGKVIGINDEALPFADVMFYDSSGIKVNNMNRTDVYGNYKFVKVKPGYYQIKTAYFGYPPKSFVIKINKDTTINIDMLHPCEYDKSIHDSICPFCHKADSVINIDNDMAIKTTEHNIIYSPRTISYIYCHPHWFCKRDKLQF